MIKGTKNDAPELLRGAEFSVERNGLDLYLRVMEKLESYTSTMYKNIVDILKGLKQDRLLTFTPT